LNFSGFSSRQLWRACSNRRYDRFVELAVRAIIRAQIKTSFFRFDASKYQRPAAFGAGRPEIVDELKIKRVYHNAYSQRLYRPNSESIPPNKIDSTCSAGPIWLRLSRLTM
jgi:hypothetical protein